MLETGGWYGVKSDNQVGLERGEEISQLQTVYYRIVKLTTTVTKNPASCPTW